MTDKAIRFDGFLQNGKINPFVFDTYEKDIVAQRNSQGLRMLYAISPLCNDFLCHPNCPPGVVNYALKALHVSSWAEAYLGFGQQVPKRILNKTELLFFAAGQNPFETLAELSRAFLVSKKLRHTESEWTALQKDFVISMNAVFWLRHANFSDKVRPWTELDLERSLDMDIDTIKLDKRFDQMPYLTLLKNPFAVCSNQTVREMCYNNLVEQHPLTRDIVQNVLASFDEDSPEEVHFVMFVLDRFMSSSALQDRHEVLAEHVEGRNANIDILKLMLRHVPSVPMFICREAETKEMMQLLVSHGDGTPVREE